MNIFHLTQAVADLQAAVPLTIDPAERKAIQAAEAAVLLILRKRGVFIGATYKEEEAKPNFIPKEQPHWEQMRKALNDAVARIVHEKNLATDKLTEQQMTEAIVQAIQCGDFIKLVTVGTGAQQVIYTPFAEFCENNALKLELRQIQDALDNYWRTQPDTLAAVNAVMEDVRRYRAKLNIWVERFPGSNIDNVSSVVGAYVTTTDGVLKSQKDEILKLKAALQEIVNSGGDEQKTRFDIIDIATKAIT